MIRAGPGGFPASIKFAINSLLLPEARKIDLYFCSSGFCNIMSLSWGQLIESNKSTRRICSKKLITSTFD